MLYTNLCLQFIPEPNLEVSVGKPIRYSQSHVLDKSFTKSKLFLLLVRHSLSILL
jgi:hypothetical protein